MRLGNFLGEIDSNSNLAATIAIVMLVAIVVGCALWLIIKKLILNKIYHADEKFVREYREKLKEREKQAEGQEIKKDSIGEDF